MELGLRFFIVLKWCIQEDRRWIWAEQSAVHRMDFAGVIFHKKSRTQHVTLNPSSTICNVLPEKTKKIFWNGEEAG